MWVSAARRKSWLVRGRDGSVAWESDSIFGYANRAAAGDVDGDRADDLVVVSNGTYGVYRGRDAKPLHGPKDVRELGGEFFATPLLADDSVVLLTVAKRSVLAS